MARRTRRIASTNRTMTHGAPGATPTTTTLLARAPERGRGDDDDHALDDADEALVERAVQALRSIVVAGQVQLIAQAGEYILEHFYGGDAERARSHRADKPAALRRLAERADEFGLRPSQVLRCVPFALQVRQLGHRLAFRLRQDHHLALLPLRDPEEKKVLAEAALEAEWSATELRQKVKTLQQPHPGGRAPEPQLAVLLGRMERLVDGADGRILADLDRLAPAEVRRLLAIVRKSEGLLERAKKALSRR